MKFKIHIPGQPEQFQTLIGNSKTHIEKGFMTLKDLFQTLIGNSKTSSITKNG